MNSQELINDWAHEFSRYKWNWSGTLSFRRRDLPFWMANRIFKDWILHIEIEAGKDNFHWFRVTERVAYEDNIHFHVLIGGLRNGSKHYWVYRWQELAGDAVITYYFRSGGATRYVVKTARPDRDFEIDFLLDRNTRRRR